MVFLVPKGGTKMIDVVFFIRNIVGDQIMRGEFSSIGVLTLDSEKSPPLHPDLAFWPPESLTGNHTLAGKALAEFLRENPRNGEYLLRVIEAVAKEMNAHR